MKRGDTSPNEFGIYRIRGKRPIKGENVIMQIEQKIHVGTSGWCYPQWCGPFYPQGLAAEAMLAFYSRHLKTVEINGIFDQPPPRESLTAWHDMCQPEFNFAIKAYLCISPGSKRVTADDSLRLLLERIKVLEFKLGPVLFQLPRQCRADLCGLEAFLEQLPDEYRYAFEFHHHSWYTSGTYETLQRHGAALCIHDLGGYRSPRKVTADHVYLRLLGPHESCRGEYDAEALIGLAGDLYSWAHQGREVYCYFENNEAGFAVKNALTLHGIINS